MYVLTPQALTKCAPKFWAAAFSMKILASNGFCEMSMCNSTAQARAKCAAQFWGAAFFL